MQQNLEVTLALLTRTPAALNALLRDLPEIGLITMKAKIPGPSSTSWFTSFILSGRTGCRASIDSFNLAKLGPSISLTGEATCRRVKVSPCRNCWNEFAHLRGESLRELSALNLREGDMERRGQHPALGAVTLAQLLATWAAHDLTHLHQISRVMAHQYRGAVGPWIKYIGVMHCAGHGA